MFHSRTLAGVVAFLGLATLAAAQTPDPNPLPAYSWVTCAPNGHQATVFAEGTAWNRSLKAAWLTVYNPTDSPQDVWVRVYVDGFPNHPVRRHRTLPPHGRVAWHMNDEFVRADKLPDNMDLNFATEVFFDTVGVANLAIWELNPYTFPLYVRAAYVKGSDQCVTW